MWRAGNKANLAGGEVVYSIQIMIHSMKSYVLYYTITVQVQLSSPL